jgi:hypothetical protein
VDEREGAIDDHPPHRLDVPCDVRNGGCLQPRCVVGQRRRPGLVARRRPAQDGAGGTCPECSWPGDRAAEIRRFVDGSRRAERVHPRVWRDRQDALWNAGLGYARELGSFRACRSTPSEAELSYAGLADVLGECRPRRSRACRGAAPRARGGAAGSSPARRRSTTAPWPRPRSVSVVRVVRPVLMALDDPQWMDDASRTTLACDPSPGPEPVGVLAAVRTGRGRPTRSALPSASR